jgi:hypothetical protein
MYWSFAQRYLCGLRAAQHNSSRGPPAFRAPRKLRIEEEMAMGYGDWQRHRFFARYQTPLSILGKLSITASTL